MKTNHPRSNVLARFIVFQRNGGTKLDDLIIYYSKVVDFESIVIIDHLSKDHLTSQVLEKYIPLGIHVWSCTGPFITKANIWSMVTTEYKTTSDFMFPINVDEFVAVIRPAKDNKNNLQLLEWNLVKFEAALGRLNHFGKPFKMENVFNMPYACDLKNDTVDRLATQVATATENLQDSKLMSDSCRAKCAVRRLRNSSLVGCMAKNSLGANILLTPTLETIMVTLTSLLLPL